MSGVLVFLEINEPRNQEPHLLGSSWPPASSHRASHPCLPPRLSPQSSPAPAPSPLLATDLQGKPPRTSGTPLIDKLLHAEYTADGYVTEASPAAHQTDHSSVRRLPAHLPGPRLRPRPRHPVPPASSSPMSSPSTQSGFRHSRLRPPAPPGQAQRRLQAVRLRTHLHLHPGRHLPRRLPRPRHRPHRNHRPHHRARPDPQPARRALPRVR